MQQTNTAAHMEVVPPPGQQIVRAPPDMGPPPRRRVYQEWQGNEVFFCWGCLVAGPNYQSLFGTTLAIVAPLVIYLIFVGDVLEREVSIALPAVGGSLGLLALFFLYRTGCMDPGILPRQEPDIEARMGRKPKSKEVIVNGHKVLVRYNETCHFYQPPRAHHCSVNDNCVEKFDHHCPWVGTTIGLRNYRWFLLFIFTASTLCLYVCVTSVLTIKLELDNLTDEAKENEQSKPSVWKGFREAPAAVALAAYTALFFLFVGGLSFFHMYLVSTNQTTYENFRYGYDRSRNPYDRGCLHNWGSVWCVPTPPCKVDYRARVQLGGRAAPPPPPPQEGVFEEGDGMGGSLMGKVPVSPNGPRKYAARPVTPLRSAHSMHGEGPTSGGRAPRGGPTPRGNVTIDVEMGPMEIRHNPEGGGKLQVVHQVSSKELEGLAKTTMPRKSQKRMASPADIHVK